MTRTSLILVSLGSWLLASQAAASGFAASRFAGPHGHPLTSNATALYFNPAALSAGTGTRLFLEGMYVMRRVNYERTRTAVPEPEDAPGINLGKARLAGGGPTATLAGATRIGDLSIGAGFFLPFGGGAEWPENEDYADNLDYPGGVDGVQRFQSIAGVLGTLYMTLGGAYEIGETGLSLGLSANLIRSSAQLVRAQTPSNDDNVELEGRVFLDVRGWQGSFGAGLMYEALPETLWLAASYQAPPGMYRDMELNGELITEFASGPNSTDVVLFQQLPDIVRVGARYRVDPDLELRLYGNYIHWSVFEAQCVARLDHVQEADQNGNPCDLDERGAPPENAPSPAAVAQRRFQDAFNLRLGVSYWATPAWELVAGVGWDGSAIPDATLEPALYDADDFELSLGARLTLNQHVALALSHTHVQYLPRENQGKGSFEQFAGASKSPPSEGTFSSWVGLTNANVELAF